MSAAEAYLDAAGRAVALLGRPEVAEAWKGPSALAEMTVGGLAGHLAYQILSVESALEEPASEQAPIPLLEHYGRAVWIGAPLDGDANTGIRAKGEDIGSEGARALLERAGAALARQRTGLAGWWPLLAGRAAVVTAVQGDLDGAGGFFFGVFCRLQHVHRVHGIRLRGC